MTEPPADACGLARNPFFLLRVGPLDSEATIREAAETAIPRLGVAVAEDAARRLCHPILRTFCEVAWLPGAPPAQAHARVAAMIDGAFPAEALCASPLARANLVLAMVELGRASELFDDDTAVLLQAADAFRTVNPEAVATGIERDRRAAGFASDQLPVLVAAALTEQRSALVATLRRHLDSRPSETLIAALSQAVEQAYPCDPDQEDPTLARLIGLFAAQSGPALAEAHSGVLEVFRRIGERSVDPLADLEPQIDRLDHRLETWCRIARPLSRHRVLQRGRFADAEALCAELWRESRDLAGREHYRSAQRILHMALARLDLAEKTRRSLSRETAALDRVIAEVADAPDAAPYAARIGSFGRRLWIDQDEVGFDRTRLAPRSVSAIHWGAGAYGADGTPYPPYAIGFAGAGRRVRAMTWSSAVYDAFTGRLWRRVGPRLSRDMAERLRSGRRVHVGSLAMTRDGVDLARSPRDGARRVPWSDLSCGLRQGRLVLHARADPTLQASLSLRDTPNALVLEHLIRGRTNPTG